MNKRFFKGEKDDEGWDWTRGATLQPADGPLPSECAHHFLSPRITPACWRRSRSTSVLQSIKVFKFSLSQPLHSGFLPFQLDVPWKANRRVGWCEHRVVPKFKCVSVMLVTFHGIQGVHLLQSRVADKPDGLTVAFVVQKFQCALV